MPLREASRHSGNKALIQAFEYSCWLVSCLPFLLFLFLIIYFLYSQSTYLHNLSLQSHPSRSVSHAISYQPDLNFILTASCHPLPFVCSSFIVDRSSHGPLTKHPLPLALAHLLAHPLKQTRSARLSPPVGKFRRP
jgi:hypothetical protein